MKKPSLKHIFAFVLCILMVFLLFACETNKETNDAEETTTAEETTVEETTVEETTVEETTNAGETTNSEETTDAEETENTEPPRTEAYLTTEMCIMSEAFFYEHHRSADGKIQYTLVRSYGAYGIVVYRMDYSYDKTTSRLSEMDISFCDTRIEYAAYAQILTYIGEYRFVADESGVKGTYYKLNSHGEYVQTPNTMSIKYDGANVVEAVADQITVIYENGVKKSENSNGSSWGAKYTYDKNGSMKTFDMIYEDESIGVFTLGYDEHGYLASAELRESESELDGFYFTFDPETGYATKHRNVSADNGVEDLVAESTITYTENGGISSVNTVGYSRSGDGKKSEFEFNFAMSYNEDGHITLITETEFDNNDNGKREKHYSYDENGRLSEEIKLYWYPDLNGDLIEEYARDEKFSYQYDEYGRLIEKKTVSSDGDNFTESYAYDEYDRIIRKEEKGTKINDGLLVPMPEFNHILNECTYHKNGKYSSETRTSYNKQGEIIDKMRYEYNEDGDITAEIKWELSEGQLIQVSKSIYTYRTEYDDADETLRSITEIITYGNTGEPVSKEVRTITYSGNSASDRTYYYIYSDGEWVER